MLRDRPHLSVARVFGLQIASLLPLTQETQWVGIEDEIEERLFRS